MAVGPAVGAGWMPASVGAAGVSLGRVLLGVGDDDTPTVYTTAGAKSLGGLDFTLAGVNSTNTWEGDAQGMRPVGGSGLVYAAFAAPPSRAIRRSAVGADDGGF